MIALFLASVLAPRDPGMTPRALVCWDAGLEAAFPGFAARIEAWLEQGLQP